MKTIFLSVLFASGSLLVSAQNKETKLIKETIHEFAKAGDMYDAVTLANYLDDNYRIVMNRLFGSSEVIILSKENYLTKIKSKEFGGDPRTLTFDTILINGSTATAKVTFKGSKLTFVSLITLIKNADGNWKLVCDVPIVK